MCGDIELKASYAYRTLIPANVENISSVPIALSPLCWQDPWVALGWRGLLARKTSCAVRGVELSSVTQPLI